MLSAKSAPLAATPSRPSLLRQDRRGSRRGQRRQVRGAEPHRAPARVLPVVHREGPAGAVRRDQPDQGLHRQGDGAPVPRLRVRDPEVLRGGVPDQGPHVQPAAVRQRRAPDQGDGRDPAPARLHGRLPVDDRPGHVRHQRRRARRRQPARPLAGRVLQRARGPGVRPDAVLAPRSSRTAAPGSSSRPTTRTSCGSRSTASARSRRRPCSARSATRPTTRSPRCSARSTPTPSTRSSRTRSTRTSPRRPTRRSSRSTRSCARAIRPRATTPASWSRACSSTSAATTSVGSAATSSTRSSTASPRAWASSSPREQRTITSEDIAAIVGHLIECNRGLHPKDDIDHLGNRRIRANGELIQNAFRIGLLRMERVVRERMTIQEIDKATPNALINIRPVVAAMKEFFGGSQLCQFMDQTNPLAELTSKRRLQRPRPGRPVARARRVRRPRRPPQPLRPDLPDRDAGRSEHRPDRLARDVRPDQQLRLHRDALPQGQADRRLRRHRASTELRGRARTSSSKTGKRRPQGRPAVHARPRSPSSRSRRPTPSRSARS